MSRPPRRRKPVIAFFGEHDHDARAIRELVKGLRPELGDVNQLRILKSPPTLVKDLQEAKRRTRSAKVVATLRGVEAVDGLGGVVFHADADRVEPAHEHVESVYRDAYSAVPCEIIVAAPAWELEAWWFLFPSAVVKVSVSWRTPDRYVGKHVGKIRNAKEELARAVRPPGRRSASFREYREEDAEVIAKHVVELGLVTQPLGESASWARFVAQVNTLGRT